MNASKPNLEKEDDEERRIVWRRTSPPQPIRVEQDPSPNDPRVVRVNPTHPNS